ncbi:MAG: fused MFS/spermidine synthase [Patescibacteria group bacterium]
MSEDAQLPIESVSQEPPVDVVPQNEESVSPDTSHHNAPRYTFARAIVFFASFCLMTIELVAGRVMAPYLGVSLYTWTSVIVIVLLGVTLGNYAGGRLADMRLSRMLLGGYFLLAGLATLLMIVLAPVIGPRLAGSDIALPLSTALFCFLAFFPVGFFLSMISPQVVKGDLHTLETTGATIGTIGAWSAIGSILGTFATGFVFVMYVGTRQLLWTLSAALILVGLATMWRIGKKSA